MDDNAGHAQTNTHEDSHSSPSPGTYGPLQNEDINEYRTHERELSGISLGDRRSPPMGQTSAPGVGQQSTMSRLGTRILPNAVVRGLLNSGEETPAEGRAHRTGLFSPTSPGHNSRRFSAFSNIGSRGITRRRSTRGPYPLPRSDITDPPTSSSYLRDASIEQDPDATRLSWRRRARFNRVRHSIAGPISQMFGQQNPTAPSETTDTFAQPSRADPAEGRDELLPALGAIDTRMDLDEPLQSGSFNPTNNETITDSPENIQPSNQEHSGPHRSPGAARGRHTRLLRRDDQAPLARVLQLAAAAIAAQLSGSTGPQIPNIQPVGPNSAEGSLENFIQTLRQATSAQNRAPDGESNGTNQADGGPSNVNFLRVFRFSNPDNQQEIPTLGHGEINPSDQNVGSEGMDVDNSGQTEGNQDRRLVTLVVVGVRSVSNINRPNSSSSTRGNARQSLEPILRLFPNHSLRNERRSHSLLRRTDGRSRFSTHRHSTEGNAFAADAGNQGTSSRRPSDATVFGGPSTPPPTISSETPPGPNPPPSTPADPTLPNASSGSSAPYRRLSSTSATLPQLSEDTSGNAERLSEESPFLGNVRQRRRSDSEAARHRGLGSGAARRNGVVEPDNASPTAGRSWLIYVVGTNLSENHPAFATPSLFTDVSLLLKLVLGPQLTKFVSHRTPHTKTWYCCHLFWGP